jgi:hypothetical protein
MLNMDDARINSCRQFCFLLHPTATRLDPHPVAIDNAMARCRRWVDFGQRMPTCLAQIGDLTMFRIEED